MPIGPVATVAIIIGVVATVILFSQSLVVVAGLALSEILTEMPTFYEYSEYGGRAYQPVACDVKGDNYSTLWCGTNTAECNRADASTNPKCQIKPSVYIDYYWLLAGIGMSIMLVAICISVVQYLMEGSGIVKQGEAVDRIKKIVPYLIFIILLPTVWDPVAITIEELSLFLMAPFPPEHDPYIDVGVVAIFVGAPEDSFRNHAQLRGAWLFMEAGSIIPPTVWQPDAIIGFILDPVKAVTNTFSGAFLGIFKAVVVITLALELWVTGILRVMATMITVMAMPIMLSLSLIPHFSKATGQITSTLGGLMIAPIFSATIFTIGLAYLSASRHDDEIVRWLQALAVCFLCSSGVTVLAGGFFMNAKGELMGALKGALMSATIAATSVVTGGATGVAGMAGAGGSIGKAAMSAGTAGIKGTVQGMTSAATNNLGTGGTGGTSGGDGGSSTKRQILTGPTQRQHQDGGMSPGSGRSAAAPGTISAIPQHQDGGMTPGAPGSGLDVMPGSEQEVGPIGTGDVESQGTEGQQGIEGQQPETGGTEEYPDEVPVEGGKPVKKPENLVTDKPKKMDYFKSFLFGAITSSASNIMGGAMPKGYGADKAIEPLSKKVTESSKNLLAGHSKDFMASAKYHDALNNYKKAQGDKKSGTASEEDAIDGDVPTDGTTDPKSKNYKPSYIG